MAREEDFDILADELAIDKALVDVFRVYPQDSWREAPLRDIVGLVMNRNAHHRR